MTTIQLSWSAIDPRWLYPSTDKLVCNLVNFSTCGTVLLFSLPTLWSSWQKKMQIEVLMLASYKKMYFLLIRAIVEIARRHAVHSITAGNLFSVTHDCSLKIMQTCTLLANISKPCFSVCLHQRTAQNKLD